jgi:hypothetical protein
VRQREEVINTVLAARIAYRGSPANPETIRRRGAARPDVIAMFRGLRCVFEGKVADVPNARSIVCNDAQRRVEEGIAQVAVAIVYPEQMRTTPFAQLPGALDSAQFDFCIQTENGTGDWHTGGIDEILGELRRAHDVLLTDDVVKQVSDDLSQGLEEIAGIFIDDAAVCDRLVQLLGIGSQETDDADAD